MISDRYKKGTEIYDSVYWLLKHYCEFKFYNIVGRNEVVNDIIEAEGEDSYSISDVIIFAEKEESCIRRTQSVVSYAKSEYCEDLVKIMDRAYTIFIEYGGHYILQAEILHKRFMLKSTDCRQPEEMTSGYYNQIKCAIEQYCEIFAAVIKRNRRSFLDICTDRDIVREVEAMQKAYRVHSKDGICFRDTASILKSYKDIKYSGIQERIGDSSKALEEFLCSGPLEKHGYDKTLDRIEYMNLSKPMNKWMYSSMMETTNAYLSLVDEALRRMSWLGEQGKRNRRILEILFTDPGWYRISNEEKLKELGLSSRQLYDRKYKAIEMLSKVMWGTLGHRHCNSIFYGI